MRPLDGLTVVDLTRVLSGPYCTMLLADMGARVVKIERPGTGDDTRAWGPPFVGGESSYFLSINRNKESVALDFKEPRGRAILDRLIARADVLVENFHPGTLDALGLGYTSLAQQHPRLVYCSITGFGATGPLRHRPGYDAVVQAEGGLMSLTGPGDGEPYRLGVAIADIAAGMFAAQGIALALLVRERTGKGQFVDIGMLDSVASLLTYQAGICFTTGRTPMRMGNRHPSIAPYDTVAAEDGTLVLAVGNDGQWRTFCQVTGLASLADDARFATNALRVEHYDGLRPLIARVMRTRSRQEWIDRLVPAGVPCAAVRDVDEVLADPQLAAREMIQSVLHPSAGPLKVLGVPIKLSDTPGGVDHAPPRLGEHTASVLQQVLGLAPEEIATLNGDGVIGVAE
ncbi:MAG: CoA transferase [Vicinamibacterales bacterium]|jgi:crotonobetainyl-CoA:carnitine CoA-transferase CaiB-like acyl-CoA transferase|nr:CoA transferase [Vicinamibacterales bacterium]